MACNVDLVRCVLSNKHLRGCASNVRKIECLCDTVSFIVLPLTSSNECKCDPRSALSFASQTRSIWTTLCESWLCIHRYHHPKRHPGNRPHSPPPRAVMLRLGTLLG